MILSIDAEKAFEKNLTHFHDKNTQQTRNRMELPWDFPGGPVVKTLPSNTGGKIPHASGPKNQNIKTEAVL